MKKARNQLVAHSQAAPIARTEGPSLLEVAYLRELHAELQIFLRSRQFTTIKELQVAFAGNGYNGCIQVKA